MGRAARKGIGDPEQDGLEPGGTRQHWTDTHPDRELWSPGRLAQARTQTQEEYEALYGRSVSVPKETLSSPLFPNLSREELEKLQYGTFTGEEARELLSKMTLSSNFAVGHLVIQKLADDPVLQAFWKSEVRRIKEEQEMFREEEIRHWSQDLADNEEKLREAWFQKIVASWFWRPEEQKFAGWQSSEEGARRMRRLPHSITAAAIESGVLEEHVLAQNLFFLSKRDEAKADSFFTEYIKPEIDYFTLRNPNYSFSRLPSNILLGELWKLAARDLCQGSSIIPEMLNVEQNMNRFSNFLPPAEREVFRATPLALDQSKAFADGWDRGQVGLFQEAWARKGHWDYNEEYSSNQQYMINAVNGILGNHLVRVYSGLDQKEIALDPDRAAKLRQIQEETVQSSKSFLGKITQRGVEGELPLDNLRPIFDREEAGDHFKNLQKEIRRFLADGRSFDPESFLVQDPVALLDPSNHSGTPRFIVPRTTISFDDLYNSKFSFSNAIASRIQDELQNVFSVF